MRAQMLDDISEFRELRIAGSIEYRERSDGSLWASPLSVPAVAATKATCRCEEAATPMNGTGTAIARPQHCLVHLQHWHALPVAWLAARRRMAI